MRRVAGGRRSCRKVFRGENSRRPPGMSAAGRPGRRPGKDAMSRAFLVVMDSVGCGGAPDADRFFNDRRPDTGANTLGHIAQACAEGRAEEGRSGPLHAAQSRRARPARAIRLASGLDAPGLAAEVDRLLGRGDRDLAGQGHALGPLGAGRRAGALGLALFPRHATRPFRPIWRPRSAASPAPRASSAIAMPRAR